VPRSRDIAHADAAVRWIITADTVNGGLPHRFNKVLSIIYDLISRVMFCGAWLANEDKERFPAHLFAAIRARERETIVPRAI
jgi:hypothetical protein